MGESGGRLGAHRGGQMMKIWYLIRRPVGYLLFTAISYAVLILAHAIPYALTDWILGL